ncbi:MAG TPA: DinB family protein [Vicinamibacterales bacterium]|jgi:uncharacterized damage-inducible protein DinB|nr:DinB family protein [Vicinamibacterales bacterium]
MRMLIPMAFAFLAGAGPAMAQPATTNPVSDSIRTNWNTAERNMKESAELMEEANYSFKPVDSVRTFGAILAHVAGANYLYCASVKGEKAPHAEADFEKTLTSKNDIVKALNESLVYCDGAYTAATDASLARMTNAPFGSGQVAVANALIGNIGHLNEHYGNLVTYFRIKGIVPPSSRR